MLKTLVKHEMKSTGRTMAAIYVIFAAATVLACMISFWRHHAGSSSSSVFWAIPLMLYAITIVILMAVSLIYLCWKFYYTMFSAQGYLTHTLPVKTSWILNCKIFVSNVFFLLTCAVCLLSMAVTGAVSTGEGINMVVEVVRQTVSEGARELGMQQTVFVLFMVCMVFLSSLNCLMIFFAGSSIGQLSKRSKGAAGIAAGIGLYYASQIVTVILMLVYYVFLGRFTTPGRAFFVLMIAVEVLWICVYYLISRVILLKHLNLE